MYTGKGSASDSGLQGRTCTGPEQRDRCAVQATHVGKVTVRTAGAQQTPPAGDSTSGAVLITGGLGALGSLLATWLAKRSAATRLVLVGRTGHLPQGAGSGPLQELVSSRAGGGMTTLRMGDAASAADAAAACLTGSGKQPPLRVWLGVRTDAVQSPSIDRLRHVVGLSWRYRCFTSCQSTFRVCRRTVSPAQ